MAGEEMKETKESRAIATLTEKLEEIEDSMIRDLRNDYRYNDRFNRGFLHLLFIKISFIISNDFVRNINCATKREIEYRETWYARDRIMNGESVDTLLLEKLVRV